MSLLRTGLTAGVDVGHTSDHNQAHAKLNDFPNVRRDYGATGDGVTDDTAVIQQAFDDNAGITVLVPKGTYRVSALSTNGEGQIIQGAGGYQWNGIAKTIFKAKAGFTGDIFTVAANGQTLERFFIDGNNGGGGHAHSGIWYDNGGKTVTRQVCVTGCQVGVRIDHAVGHSNNEFLLDAVVAKQNTIWGIGIMPGTPNVTNNNQAGTILNCTCFVNGTSPGNTVDQGGCLIKANLNKLLGGDFEGNYGCGIQIGETIDNGGFSTATVVMPNDMEGNSMWDLYSEYGARNLFIGSANFNIGLGSHADLETIEANNNEIVINTDNSRATKLRLSSNQVLAGGTAANLILKLLGKGTGGVQVDAAGGRVGFYGTTPVARPSITGSRGGNAALASLITQLASQGLVTDNTTA
jgi:hypothetical protein